MRFVTSNLEPMFKFWRERKRGGDREINVRLRVCVLSVFFCSLYLCFFLVPSRCRCLDIASPKLPVPPYLPTASHGDRVPGRTRFHALRLLEERQARANISPWGCCKAPPSLSGMQGKSGRRGDHYSLCDEQEATPWSVPYWYGQYVCCSTPRSSYDAELSDA